MKSKRLRAGKNWLLFKIAPSIGMERMRQEEKAAQRALTGKTAFRIFKRHLEIPEGTTEIGHTAFEGNRKLVSVSVPSTVKKIGDRAFAKCENLEHVILHEGLESIGDNVFTDCPKLHSIVIPNSVTRLRGQAFYHCGLTEPVLNAAGDTLYFCPEEAAGTEYIVPEGVRHIGGWAFRELPHLRQVQLPKSLESIAPMAFVQCGLELIKIPAGVKDLGEGTFWDCKELKTIVQIGVTDILQSALDRFRIQGKPFLVPIHPCELPEEVWWEQEDFQALARACGTGDPTAMDRMADFFEKKRLTDPESRFCIGAEVFWRVRAYEHGSQRAREWMMKWLDLVLEGPLPSTCLTEKLEGFADGCMLNALGFPFFDPDRSYHLAGRDADGVVEVSAYESEDGPDEDGFGREIYYDWWYLDDNLCPAPGADCLHRYSKIDKCANEKHFQEIHDIVAQTIAQQRATTK